MLTRSTRKDSEPGVLHGGDRRSDSGKSHLGERCDADALDKEGQWKFKLTQNAWKLVDLIHWK